MAEQKEHCDHECVCNKYINHTNTGATQGRTCNGETWCFKPCSHDTRSRPAISPQFNSTELLLLANDEWKRRQERKHLNDNPAWVSGFIGGFLTDKKWARDYVNNLISKGA
jgi:hypothetical protein